MGIYQILNWIEFACKWILVNSRHSHTDDIFLKRTLDNSISHTPICKFDNYGNNWSSETNTEVRLVFFFKRQTLCWLYLNF